MAIRAVLFSTLLTLCLATSPASAKDNAWQGPYEAAKKALQQNRLAVAEKFSKEAIRKAEAGGQDELVSGILNELAVLYMGQSRYGEAAEVYKRSLTVL